MKIQEMVKPVTAQDRTQKRMSALKLMVLATIIVIIGVLIVQMTFAADEIDTSAYMDTITPLVRNIIKIVGTIFQVVGIILAAYAAGSLILAFKNEDANSKSNAAMLLVVGGALIVMPSILNALDLASYIGAS